MTAENFETYSLPADIARVPFDVFEAEQLANGRELPRTWRLQRVDGREVAILRVGR